MPDNADRIPRRVPSRRSQAERSLTTRHLALEATLEGLAEVGHERISTSLIAEKAKISRGALTHQFPTRQDLFVAALRHLNEDWERLSPVGYPPQDRVMTLAELAVPLWESMFSDRRYIASVELMLAARQDNDLGRMLRAEMSRWLKIRDRKLLELLGHDENDEAAKHRLHLTLSALRGIAVHRSFDQDDALAPQLVALWVQILSQSDLCK